MPIKVQYLDTGVTQFKVSKVDVEIIASQDKDASEFVPQGFIAIIAKQDLEFGINRKGKEKYNIDLTMA